ncbi:hypothetical protein [Nocardia cyriacigeorgica]|uniref:hypothetical protein n=1 Tax=Nocardia cyriacigeorgica TaxID=135487 RepID=UPI00201719D4|nr:hypothetical protein [Nocardia cyriacigeorgica]
MQESDRGRVFRQAWIDGVEQYYPGDPKPGYIAPWEEMPEWERASAIAVFDQVAEFVESSAGNTSKLTREQKGRWLALCWIGQIYKHIPDPKPGYVADWDQLPQWQQETDSDIFEAIERWWFSKSAG